MRILAIDGDNMFRRAWEADAGKELGAAHDRLVQYVARNREGFDRVVLAWDGGRSFRRAAFDGYKAGRADPGESYREQRKRVLERLRAEGCATIPGPEIEVDGYRGFAEADDVLAWVAAEFEAQHDGTEESFLRVVSGDSDLEAIVSHCVEICKPGAKAEEATWFPETVETKRGVKPRQIPHLKALKGDGDEYPGFDGVGDVCAAFLVQRFGGAIDAVTMAPADTTIPAKQLSARARASLSAEGAVELAARYLWLATLRPNLPLDYQALVVVQPPTGPVPEAGEYFAEPEAKAPSSPPQVAPAPVEKPAQVQAIVRAEPAALSPMAQHGINPFALQPGKLRDLHELSRALHNSGLFPQFNKLEGIMAAVLSAHERGVPAMTAIQNSYVVKGKLAHSAGFLGSLVLASGKAEYFELIPEQCNAKQAVVRFKRRGRPAGEYKFTIEQAQKRNWISQGGKWQTEPETMLRWAALREAARAFFFDVVSNVYEREEIEEVES